MKIIITRPIEDALPLATKLEAMGHEVMIAPVLQIVPRAGIEFASKPYQAICLTSANGVRVLQDVEALRALPVLAVGPQSQAVAIERGFANVQAQGGDVIGLVVHITANLKPQDGPILYISGSQTSGNLEGRLQSAGFDVDRVITYDAVPADLAGFENEIQSSQAVLLYSPRSAKLWTTAINNLQLQHVAATLRHVCLSQAIAACLPESWPKHIAKNPTEAALIAALDC